MKINKIRSKLHFLKKRRNKNDSTCVYVAWSVCWLLEPISDAVMKKRLQNGSRSEKTVKHATQ